MTVFSICRNCGSFGGGKWESCPWCDSDNIRHSDIEWLKQDVTMPEPSPEQKREVENRG